ncbi:MAG: peptide chain release factor 1 [Anaerolineales bacterium]|nr:peptide chain release factor 1 [Anaerolineales bacterium]
MLEKLAAVEERYNELERMMGDPEIAADYEKVAEYAQERSDLEPVVMAFRKLQQIEQELEEARMMLEIEESPDMQVMIQDEIDGLEPHREKLLEDIKLLLLPKDPRDARNVIIEIRAGAGGDEAGIFGADLYRMYNRYAEKKGWKTELLSSNETGVGGFKEVIFMIKGRGAYSRFKYESGVHRVQRIPITESQGRIHTSTATVAVMPEVDDVDIQIDPKDLEIVATMSAGPGGQHMQKNATAIRIIHKPTGLVVFCQNERSQTQNKMQAMAVLRARLYDLEQSKQDAEVDEERRSQVGSGDRSEKIRTYNYPQSRVTDHRIGKSMFNLPVFMEGSDLDEFIDDLATQDQAEKLAHL